MRGGQGGFPGPSLLEFSQGRAEGGAVDQEVIEQADLRHGAWLETACAFANGRGGSLLVEVPETRRGKTPLETLEWLPVRLYEELGITCEVSLVMVGGRMGVEAAVLPSAQPVSYEGRFFQRRDGQTSLLVGTDLVRFLRGRGEEEEPTWERRPVSAARLEDLDPATLRALLVAAEGRARTGAADERPAEGDEGEGTQGENAAEGGRGGIAGLLRRGDGARRAVDQNPWDEEETPGAGGWSADDLLSEELSGGGRHAAAVLRRLAALNLADEATGFANNACVALAHRAPDELIAGAFTVIGFFEDEGAAAPCAGGGAPSRRVEVRGPLVSQANEAVRVILSAAGVADTRHGREAEARRATSPVRSVFRTERSLDAPPPEPAAKDGELPAAALREALLNALAHKDYAAGAPVQVSVYPDRVTIANVGRPPTTWTADDLASPHSARPANPIMAAALAALGATGSWGRGTHLMADACARAGLSAPVFALGVDETSVTLPLVPPPVDPLEDLRLSSVDRRLLELLRDLDRPNAADLAAALGVSDSTVRRSLKRLTQLRLIARHGSTKTGFWRVLP